MKAMHSLSLFAVVLVICSTMSVQVAGNATQPLPAMNAGPFPGTITVAVDASEAPRRIFHAKLAIPVNPGPLTLLYPEWIPGEHMPSGPIQDLTGLKFTAGGQTLRWRRDDVNMYAIHVDIPQGAATLDISLDYTSPATLEQGFTAGSTATAQMAVLSWNWMLLYPQGYAADQITYKPSLKLPAGWQFGTALPGPTRSGDTVEFQPASLYTLVDSPVISGHFFKVVPLTNPGAKPEVEMDIASDSAAALAMTPETGQHYKQLVAEATTLFGATHYRDYHFLLSLSDQVAHFGLEHHESNDSRTRERSLIDPQQRLLMASLLPHEYTHSWNGKFRRPDGLTTPDYSEPMKGELLWVYEGLTDYLGNVLSARSGLRTPEQYRDALAIGAANMQYRSGRIWRPLIDTTIAAQILYDAPPQWENWRRSVDFYTEGDLVWIDVDTTIRRLTNGRKTLDDFCKLFYGPPSLPLTQAPMVKPYSYQDIVNALNQVAPNDWRKFLDERLWSTSANAPLAGIEASGWKLVFDENPSETFRAAESLLKITDLTYSVGMMLDEENHVVDIVFGSAADKAGIAPGMKLEAINGRAVTPDTIHDALNAAKGGSQPMQFLVKNNDYFETLTVNYNGGNRYPHLVSNGQPDTLSDIIRQHAATAK